MTQYCCSLTYAVLVGLRRQNVEDAERLLSYDTAESLDRYGHEEAAYYVRTIAQWHEASDGRGLTCLQRSKFNYQMLNFVIADWIPWFDGDLTTVDINRYLYQIDGSVTTESLN